MRDEYLAVNRDRWDEVAGLHKDSYDTASLLSDPDLLSGVVEMDRALMAPYLSDGSVEGLDMIHLQCHIGTDTLSWARLGARMTGLDMSGESLAIARDLAVQAGLEIEYIESTIHEGQATLSGRAFDVVYTSIGVLTWLDNLDEWACLIASILRPGGLFFIRENHPMLLCLDDSAPAGELRLDWGYFNMGPKVEVSDQDYSSEVRVRQTKAYEWPHALSEIIGALLRVGLRIVDFQEQQSLPWRFLPWMEYDEATGLYFLPSEFRSLCPLTFSLVAVR